MLWKLQVNFRTWVTLLCILGIGVFACAAASVKVSYLPNYGKEGDLLWDSRYITIWTTVELDVAITAASLPCLKPIFKKLLASTYGQDSHGTHHKEKSERRHWKSISETRPKYTKDDRGESESQLVYEGMVGEGGGGEEVGRWWEGEPFPPPPHRRHTARIVQPPFSRGDCDFSYRCRWRGAVNYEGGVIISSKTAERREG